MEALEEVCEKTNNEKAQIVTKANVRRLLKDASGAVIGCEYSDKKGQMHQEFGPVVVCTGGYGRRLHEQLVVIEIQTGRNEFTDYQRRPLHRRRD